MYKRMNCTWFDGMTALRRRRTASLRSRCTSSAVIVDAMLAIAIPSTALGAVVRLVMGAFALWVWSDADAAVDCGAISCGVALLDCAGEDQLTNR